MKELKDLDADGFLNGDEWRTLDSKAGGKPKTPPANIPAAPGGRKLFAGGTTGTWTSNSTS